MYKNMYMALLKAILLAIDILQNAVQQADRLYIESDNTPITVLPPTNDHPK